MSVSKFCEKFDKYVYFETIISLSLKFLHLSPQNFTPNRSCLLPLICNQVRSLEKLGQVCFIISRVMAEKGERVIHSLYTRRLTRIMVKATRKSDLFWSTIFRFFLCSASQLNPAMFAVPATLLYLLLLSRNFLPLHIHSFCQKHFYQQTSGCIFDQNGNSLTRNAVISCLRVKI